MDAGALNERLEVLELQQGKENIWAWVPIRQIWAMVSTGGSPQKRNLFSALGVGAQNASITLRRQPLTLHHAMRWRDKHLLLTSLTDGSTMYLDGSAAVVSPVQCQAKRTTTKLGAANRPQQVAEQQVTFPGILTEKYVRYEQEETHARTQTLYVLITPKAIDLVEGMVVTVQEGLGKGVYNLQTRHTLDEYKNEYELSWKGDV
nr:MAG TPA: hypothetical protein [Caudoviricetes sp.]